MFRIAAAITFFTRLPLWRWINIPQSDFNRIVPLWPLTGWLTGGITASVLLIISQFWGLGVGVSLALASRVIITGALHDDGFADFCDAFGGDNTRERTLAIMKDSHIGTYGVLGLLLYYLIYFSTMLSFKSPLTAACIVFASDSFSKLCSAQIINLLSYARSEGPKNRIHYARMKVSDLAICIITGILPLIAMWRMPMSIIAGCACAIIATLLMIVVMKRRIGGYTGDCCGATFLVANLSFTLAAAI